MRAPSPESIIGVPPGTAPGRVELPVRGIAAPAAASGLVPVACLLFGSGLCALVYQVAWLREMRLVFGGSTAASAAVLAIFMAGLGAGGLVLGRRADRIANPLALYARLELAIAIAAAATPPLVALARHLYVATGGAATLGLAGATAVRLALAALVLCLPTFLMGGTLPAAASAIETRGDAGRRRLAVLYGTNTLGAVAGALAATFVLLEVLGTSRMLWTACLVNALVAIAARALARTRSEAAVEARGADGLSAAGAAPAGLVLGAAFLVGFAFFLMELVWYRMLASLLSGSSFTFGLVLAMALLGVGLGGIGYAMRPAGRPPTLPGFGLVCALEAVCLAIPYALGDRIAFLALFLRSLAGFGFAGLVLGGAAVTAVVVLPASMVAGFQFPMLIALLGHGETRVGRHTGLAYAANTVGAIAGSLAGGFGALPLLTATGTWRLAVALLAGTSAVALLVSGRAAARAPRLASIGVVALAIGLLAARGPTAAWRHSPIGAGRAEPKAFTANGLTEWANTIRRTTAWAVDGVESSVALNVADSDAFIVNGKSDGSARGDAGTQVMFALLAAFLHGAPRTSLVIGLGTGSSAGWLAAIPSMERVDVVELEPAIVEVARRASAVNHDALANPKVHLIVGDAREVVLVSRAHYDVVVSEPSNPYRAGVASLFTQEFYEAAADRLAPGGVFAQWLQAYEVDGRTIATVYRTLAAVYPEVQTWQTLPSDLVLIASARPIDFDAAALRERAGAEPYRTALSVAWRTDDLEGLLAHYVATPAFARTVAADAAAPLNTDDRTPIEFGFARNAGRAALFDPSELREVARARHEDRPAVTGGGVDWRDVEDRYAAQLVEFGVPPPPSTDADVDRRHRREALRAYASGRLDAARVEWDRQPREPASSMELAMRSESLADAGDERALLSIERLRPIEPIEADVVLARLRWRQARFEEATDLLARAFERYRGDPWPALSLMHRALQVAEGVGLEHPAAAERLFAALGAPFAVHAVDDARRMTRFHLLAALEFFAHCRQALAELEPDVPWDRATLITRARCYKATNDPRLSDAERDLDRFFADEPERLEELLRAPGG
jgi:spermidine synthase